jgi:hypothetical protein
LSRADRERDSSCVLSCISGLQALLQPRHLTTGRVTLPVLHELLPLISWNLAHRPAGAEVATLARRQSAALGVVAALLASAKELVEDEQRCEEFVATAGASTTGNLDGTTDGAATPMHELLHAIAELISSAVHQFLPTFGASASHSNYQLNMQKLSDGSVYLTADVVGSLQQILALLPVYVDLVNRATSNDADGGVEMRLSQLCLALNLCQHYMRKGTADLCQAALNTVHTLLFNNALRDANGEQTSRLIPPAILTQQLTQQISKSVA